MGFFDKIKQNFTKGGVTVKLQAPASASMQDATTPVTVTVTASSSAQTITSVAVEIIAETHNRPMNNGNNVAEVVEKVVARAEHAEPFTLNAGESRDIPLSIVMNVGAAMQEHIAEGSGIQQVAHALQQLQNVSEALNQISYTYYVRAVADVDGVAFDPSDRQTIQITRPGQLGGAITTGL